MPERCAVISFSIFMASITQIRAPSSTSAPFSTTTLKHGALERGEQLLGVATAAARRALARASGRLAPAAGAAGAAATRAARRRSP